MEHSAAQGPISNEDIRQQLAELASQLTETRNELSGTQAELIRVRKQQQVLQPTEPLPQGQAPSPSQHLPTISAFLPKLNKPPVFNGKHGGQIDSWTTHMNTYVRDVGESEALFAAL